jgi:hypothetical protein
LDDSTTFPRHLPLTCLLRHWENLNPESLRKKILIFYCIQAWPKYPLGDQECWPEGESIDYNTNLQLDLFYRKERKNLNFVENVI